MLITEEYRKLNTECHEGRGWGKGGTQWLFKIRAFAIETGSHTILDYGCGKGALVDKLNEVGYEAEGYDPAVEEYSRYRNECDLVVCTDVLEHVEPDCISDVLYDIGELAHKAIFLVIALTPAIKLLSNGENAHCLVRPVHWWIDVLDLHFGKAKNFSLHCHNDELTWKWEKQ